MELERKLFPFSFGLLILNFFGEKIFILFGSKCFISLNFPRLFVPTIKFKKKFLFI